MRIEQSVLPSSDRKVESPKQILAANFRDCAFERIHEAQSDVVYLLGDRFVDEIPAQTVGMIGQADEIDTAVLG